MNTTEGNNGVLPVVNRPCVTHHHACECRERWLHQVCQMAARELLKQGQRGEDAAMQAYVEMNEAWLAMYGHEILATCKPENLTT